MRRPCFKGYGVLPKHPGKYGTRKLNCLFPSSGMGAQLFNLVKDLFDLERNYIISDFLNEDDIEILLSQNWKLLKLE